MNRERRVEASTRAWKHSKRIGIILPGSQQEIAGQIIGHREESRIQRERDPSPRGVPR